jgi:hypothetical protein
MAAEEQWGDFVWHGQENEDPNSNWTSAASPPNKKAKIYGIRESPDAVRDHLKRQMDFPPLATQATQVFSPLPAPTSWATSFPRINHFDDDLLTTCAPVR